MSNVATENAEKELARILSEASGFDLRELDQRASFLELGFDSLFLIQFTQKIKSQLKVKITFRQLIEEIPTLEALVKFIAANSTVLGRESEVAPTATPPDQPVDPSLTAGPSASDAAPSPLAEPLPQAAPLPATSLPQSLPQSLPPMAASFASQPASPPQPQPQPQHWPAPQTDFSGSPAQAASLAGLEQIISQQNQLMSLQLALLTSGRTHGPGSAPALQPIAAAAVSPPASPVAASPVVPSAVTPPADNRAASVAKPAPAAPVVAQASRDAVPPQPQKFERFGPYKPVKRSASGGLTELQQESLNRLIERFTKRTQRSREHAQKHRSHFADPRGVAGYRRVWKSIVYQISVERSAGCKLWDIDGNEYIDIAMGFGLNLFGQSPEFVTAALHQQLDRGVEVGPQSPLAGEVAALLCDFSRKDRVTFCNTGSEAVMAAMRLARTVTGKSKIVFFNKDYHGNFDEVLLRSKQVGQQRLSQPAAPGVPQSFADNAIVLDYGTPAALQTIRQHADEIAAVLVEPVQSADPFNKPREFLHEVRQITRDNDIALIMDEVITGFRAAQGGAQEWYDVWGDMATYGKVLGGGLPIGALAGSARFMDALDGGMWRYEDESEPEADMTFFAGTFVRHPLAMTAAHQILMKIKEEGAELQENLTRKTTTLVDELNRFFEEELFPFRVAQFTSLFRFMFPADLEYADLLYFHLLDRGIFTRGWGDNCFLSTAHSDQDVQRIIEAVKSSCLEIRAGGFMPKADEPRAQALTPANAKANELAQPTIHRPSRDGSQPGTTESPESLPSLARQATLDRTNRISTLEEIQAEGDLPPLFCMPAADGLSLVYHDLAHELGENQPIYGLTSPGVYGEEVPLTIEEMAERFVSDIREFRPHGPYCLLGYCSGGTIAFEVAQQLVAAGEKVAFVAGIETYDWGTAQSSRPTFWIKTYYNFQRMEFILRNFLLLKPRDQWGFLKAKLGRVKTRTRNWRGMLAGWFRSQKAVSATGAVNMHELWRLHDAQADRYRPRPFPGKLLLIRPKKDYRSYVGKEDLKATEGVRVVRIPAFPAGLLSPPYVSQVAKLIRDSMRDGLSEQYRLATADETRRQRTEEPCLPAAFATAGTR